MNPPVPPAVSSAPASANLGPRGLPLLRLGFRPFYLGAAAFACLAAPLWVALFFGDLTLGVGVAPLLWHAHEMLFGFAVAVIVGFLMTAGKACPCALNHAMQRRHPSSPAALRKLGR